ncbi:MAG: hypothetical protein JSW59_01210 [Phycisphaerales bacterium]|nr:MAG: hypothetical protein JSW59_01210 [Phycisphaerales bacterium]
MSRQVDIGGVERRLFADSQQDGLLELVMGVCMIAISTRLFSRVLVVMLVLPVILFAPLLETMRKRFTYPRIGYVRLIPDKPREVITGIFLVSVAVVCILAAAFLILGGIRDFDLWLRWCPFWGGTVLAGMFGSFASKSGAVRHHVFAAWSLLAGIVLSLIRFNAVETGTLLYFAVMGAILTPFGLVRFMAFLREHPKPLEETQDGFVS